MAAPMLTAALVRAPCANQLGDRILTDKMPRPISLRWGNTRRRPGLRESARGCALDQSIVVDVGTVSATSMVGPAPAPGSTSPVLPHTAPTAAVRPGRRHVPDWAQAPRVPACAAGNGGQPRAGHLPVPVNRPLWRQCHVPPRCPSRPPRWWGKAWRQPAYREPRRCELDKSIKAGGISAAATSSEHVEQGGRSVAAGG